jgi:hypothetical protein
MPQVRVMGTAWVRSLDDYAHTAGLDRPGWAWEFLRRNANFQRDVRVNRAGTPSAIPHASGATIYRLRRKFIAAEQWGLVAFADPAKSAREAPVFWRADRQRRAICCTARTASNDTDERINLAAFGGGRGVLVMNSSEHIAIHGHRKSASMVVTGSPFAIGDCALTFHVQGLENAAAACETLRILNQLRSNGTGPTPPTERMDEKYLSYLVALDGHLAGRTYRDIAEILYGPDRVKAVWISETRHLKDKVRRAVAAGIELMNGGYLKLLR